MTNRQQQRASSLNAAREAARAAVARHNPSLATVEPTVVERPARNAPHATPPAYVFTFASEVHTPEGYTMPLVARITVDAQQHVVKTVLSK